MSISQRDSQLSLEYLTKVEGQYLERKGARSNTAKIANELIGFLNADGGVLAFRLHDNGTVEDLAAEYTDEKLNDFRRIAHDLIKDERFEFSIPTLLEKLKNFLQARFRDYHYLNLESGTFEKIQEFPEDAWLEGIVNSICHRSYNVQGNPIFIKHYDDRLEISNSGPLPAQVTVENIQEERYTRNVRIARALSDMGYVKELNEGVPRIFGSMRDSMLADPIYTDTNNTVTLVLRNNVSHQKETILAEIHPRIQANWETLTSNQRVIISILLQKHEMIVADLALELGITEKATRDNLTKLVDLNLLERVSEKVRDKNAIYRFASS